MTELNKRAINHWYDTAQSFRTQRDLFGTLLLVSVVVNVWLVLECLG